MGEKADEYNTLLGDREGTTWEFGCKWNVILKWRSWDSSVV
jgi:hypothetical protein